MMSCDFICLHNVPPNSHLMTVANHTSDDSSMQLRVCWAVFAAPTATSWYTNTKSELFAPCHWCDSSCPDWKWLKVEGIIALNCLKIGRKQQNPVSQWVINEWRSIFLLKEHVKHLLHYSIFFFFISTNCLCLLCFHIGPSFPALPLLLDSHRCILEWSVALRPSALRKISAGMTLKMERTVKGRTRRSKSIKVSSKEKIVCMTCQK